MAMHVHSDNGREIPDAQFPHRFSGTKLVQKMYAKNLLNFLTPQIDAENKTLKIDWEDETITGTLLTRDGKVVHPMLTGEGN